MGSYSVTFVEYKRRVHVKPRSVYGEKTLALWCLSGTSSAHRVNTAEEGPCLLSRDSVYFSPWQTCRTFQRTEAWVNHNSKHRTSPCVPSPWAPPIHYTDGHVSGDEKKSGDSHWSFAASHLGSLKGSCKRQERQLLSSLGEDEPLPTDQLFHSLNWQPVPFVLKEAIVCVCLVWKRSIFVQYSSEDVARLVWWKFVSHLFVEKGFFVC